MAANKALVTFMVLVFSLFLTGFVSGQSGLNLEAEQNWDTYGVGGTCTYNTQNLYFGLRSNSPHKTSSLAKNYLWRKVFEKSLNSNSP